MSQLAGVRLLDLGQRPVARRAAASSSAPAPGFASRSPSIAASTSARCEYRGASLGWMPPTLMPGPWFFEDQTGFGWLRAGLGGFNNTCGLVHIGNPEEASVAHYNFPARPTERYGVHDRAALIPAELVAIRRPLGGRPAHRSRRSGRVTQAQTYGENLVLTRTYRAAMGASWFTMEDVVENAGFLPTEHMLLYHINIGYPFVDEGAELIAPVAGPPTLLFGDGRPRRSAPAGPASSRRRRTGCSRPSSTSMLPDADGQVEVAIFNPRLFGGTALSVRYDHARDAATTSSGG